jgi:hypothetical protein
MYFFGSGVGLLFATDNWFGILRLNQTAFELEGCWINNNGLARNLHNKLLIIDKDAFQLGTIFALAQMDI